MMGFLCAVPLLSALVSCPAAPLVVTGYAEGAYVFLAPIEGAQISQIVVEAGAQVKAGALLVQMQAEDATFALDTATASLAEAAAHLADVQEGQRPEEIALLEASLASAQAVAQEAQRTAARTTQLAKAGSVTSAQADAAETALQIATAREAEVAAGLSLARLPARAQVIATAKAAFDRAKAGASRAAWALDQRQIRAPAAGVVSDILRRSGEVAGPSAPVLQFLPNDGVTLRLYVPEAALSSLSLGTTIAIGCDGCADGLTAEIVTIADHSAFTPPVIYSRDSRQKLVVMVTARPLGNAGLKPGQIVDAVLPAAAGQ